MIVYSVVRHYWEEDDLIGICASREWGKELAEADALSNGYDFPGPWSEHDDTDEAFRTGSMGEYAVLPWNVLGA